MTAPEAIRCSPECSRFVCQNGVVCGDTVADVRIPHKGDVVTHVIEGAYEVLHGFDRAQESRDAMQAIALDTGESEVFARAALALKYDDKPAPITESQILMPRRERSPPSHPTGPGSLRRRPLACVSIGKLHG